MIGASLSRWTMSFFAVALGFLLAAQLLTVAGYGHPAAALRAPETLVLVHIVAIGWLSLLLAGALFQFVPVLVARPLRLERLVLPALFCLLAGLALLLAGFLQAAGTLAGGLPLLAAGGVALPAGFALTAAVLAATLWSARPLALPARFVAAGLACLAVAALLGALFALARSGLVALPALLQLHGEGLPVHIVAGLGGWLGFTAIGVGYRLLPMFMLAPDGERAATRLVWRAGVAALVLAVLAAPVEILVSGSGASFVAAGLLAAAALAAHALDLVHLYRHRKRRTVELNIKAAFAAFACLYLSAPLLLGLWAAGALADRAGAVVYLVGFGWLTGLGLSQLYKIVPFLTWLECYGPVMGRRPTPRVQDLVVESRGGPWFVLYFLGVLVGTAALLAGMPGLFRLAAAARLPEGVVRPRLILPRPIVKTGAAP